MDGYGDMGVANHFVGVTCLYLEYASFVNLFCCTYVIARTNTLFPDYVYSYHAIDPIFIWVKAKKKMQIQIEYKSLKKYDDVSKYLSHIL